MRRCVAPVVLGLAVLAGDAAQAKFGISKTRITLPRLRPPSTRVVAEKVAVDVKSGSPEVTGSHVSLVRGRLEESLRASGLYELVDRPREADAVIRVSLDDLRAEVRDEIQLEKKRVKIGEKQVWDEKKQKYKTEDVYGDRDQPVSFRLAEGSVNATIEVEGQGGRQTRDAGAAYRDRFRAESGVPAEASSEESLRRHLMQSAAFDIAAQVSFAPEPVEALLAVDGDLKPGNKLAQSGLFQGALEEWSRLHLKGDKEAARLHNLGVAYEALAYAFPPFTREHRSNLDKAKEHYHAARQLDPGEKYFRDPVERIETSLSYAASAADLAAEVERFRTETAARRKAPPPEPAPVPAAASAPAAPVKAPKPKPPSPAPALSGSAVVASPLRNGSFESSLASWTVTGKGTVLEEPGRGRVLELAAGSAEGRVQQAVGMDVGPGGGTLSLDYKVTSGESVIRVLVGYADASGRARTSTLEVSAGEGPGPWSPWSGDLGALRPRPSKLTEVKIVVEGGSVRLDNVAATLK